MNNEEINIVKNEIKKVTSIVNEVSKYIEIKKCETNYICKCPLCYSENDLFVINRN